MLFLQLLREPGGPVRPVARPDVAFLPERLVHHLEGGEGHPLIVLDQFAAQLHPRGLDGERLGAAEVAEFAGGAGEDGVHRGLVPSFSAFHQLAQPVPFPARGLAFPPPPVELVAFVHAVSALGAAISVPYNIRRDALCFFRMKFPYACQGKVGQRSY